MEESPRILDHARLQMRRRNVSLDAILHVLETYHTSRPAPYREGARPATIFVGEYHGRDLKVYVVQGTQPPEVATVVWEGD